MVLKKSQIDSALGYWREKKQKVSFLEESISKLSPQKSHVLRSIQKKKKNCRCPTLCNPMDCSLPGSFAHGILQARRLAGCHSLLQEIFPTQGSNRDILHCRWIVKHTGWKPLMGSQQNHVEYRPLRMSNIEMIRYRMKYNYAWDI